MYACNWKTKANELKMKAGNYFSVEYILGSKTSREDSQVNKTKNNEDDDIEKKKMKVEDINDKQQEDNDELVITSEKGMKNIDYHVHSSLYFIENTSHSII